MSEAVESAAQSGQVSQNTEISTTVDPAPQVKPRIVIHYCTGCKWMLRAAWMAQELLTTFEKEIGEVALAPSSGGMFRIIVTTYSNIVSAGGPASTETQLWDRKEKNGFPDIKELKQLVRDLIAPDKGLGHSEKKPAV